MQDFRNVRRSGQLLTIPKCGPYDSTPTSLRVPQKGLGAVLTPRISHPADIQSSMIPS